MLGTTSGRPRVVIKDVSKRYGNRWALSNVTLAIEPGTTCAILGPNGAGKSTLLKIVGGLTSPDAGSAHVGGAPTTSSSAAGMALLGVVPESLALFNLLTVAEHFQLIGKVYDVGERAGIRSSTLIEAFGLGDVADQMAGECSFGTRKKLALALAILHDPPVYVLDEPFEGLDPTATEFLLSTLNCINRNGATVIFTSHIFTSVEAVADRIVILVSGEIESDVSSTAVTGRVLEHYFSVVKPAIPLELEWIESSQS